MTSQRSTAALVAELRAGAAAADDRLSLARDPAADRSIDDGELLGEVHLGARQKLAVSISERGGRVAAIFRGWSRDNVGEWYPLRGRVFAIAPWHLSSLARLVADALEQSTARATAGAPQFRK